MVKKPKPTPKPAIKVATTHAWTPEKLAEMPEDRLQGLRDRSVRLAAPDLTVLCDAELGARAERLAQAKAAAPRRKRRASVVTEYHFVCAGDRGVIEEADGTFRTGSWVVAQEHVEGSLKSGALVALHEARDLPSYRQGTILGYQVTARDMIKDNQRIEFHVQPTPEALPWVGNGTGEKGYRWSET